MKRWKDRPVEIRNLFNPAFCAVVLARAFKAFQQEDVRGMPFTLALLVLPLCLHEATREILCENERSYFLKIVDSNPRLLVDLPQRVKAMLPYTLEALGFLTNLDCVEVSRRGSLHLRPRKVSPDTRGTAETTRCQQAAKILGRQLARLGDRVTIYTSLGIRP